MRAVVIGGSGQIGGWLLHHLATRGHEPIGTYATVGLGELVPLNAAEKARAADWLVRQAPDIVFYPAGFTWVDGCERDPEAAAEANLRQPLNLARAASSVGARFVYFSTDYVFDGTTGPNAEDDPTCPLSAYGRAKRDAEAALAAELGDAALTLRTSWVFGPERQGKNFAYQLVRSLRAGKVLTCPSDQVSNPSYGPDVAHAAVLLAEQAASGLLHLVGPDRLPRDTFAREIALGFGLNPTLIQSRPTVELPQGAPRPLHGGLRTDRLERRIPDAIRGLSEALADFCRRIDSGEGWADPAAPAAAAA